MLKSHRTIQQWNQWLTQPLGIELLKSEAHFLTLLLEKCFGNHAVLIGVPNQYPLLEQSVIHDHLLITPIQTSKAIQWIENDWLELPISSGSVDLVILPHTLEYIDNPHHVLSEACRIVKPKGSIVILNFNPHSVWGLQELFTHTRKGHLLTSSKVKQWLSLSDFQLVKQKTLLFRPPFTHEKLFQKLAFLEWLGNISLLPIGGVYVLLAKAKTIPLTPIRLRWKQQAVGNIKVSLPGPTIRNTP